VDKLQNTAGFGFDNGFHYQLAAAIQDGDHHRFLVHVHADILNVATHPSCLLEGKVIRVNAYLFPQGKVPFFSRFFYAITSQRGP
jgi:hypothetical protein